MTIRTLTLVVEVHQPQANWIWESHQAELEFDGVYVKAIAEGDRLKSETEFP